MKFLCIFTVAFSFLQISQRFVVPAKHSKFCYKNPECGPDTWGGICSSGREQSPININSTNASFESTNIAFNNHYFTKQLQIYAQNNGHTLDVSLSANQTSNLQLSGANLTGDYTFAELHFHWGGNNSKGSEHTLNGKSFPLVIDIVHYKSHFDSVDKAIASDDREAVAVFGVLLKIGLFNPGLGALYNVITKLSEPGEITKFNSTLRIIDLYPTCWKFARYLGSFTTPGCNEKLIRSVFLEPSELSENQLKAFRKLKNEEKLAYANFRPIQPLNGRKVAFFNI